MSITHSCPVVGHRASEKPSPLTSTFSNNSCSWFAGSLTSFEAPEATSSEARWLYWRLNQSSPPTRVSPADAVQAGTGLLEKSKLFTSLMTFESTELPLLFQSMGSAVELLTVEWTTTRLVVAPGAANTVSSVVNPDGRATAPIPKLS